LHSGKEERTINGVRILLAVLAAVAFIMAASAYGITQTPIIGGYLMPAGKSAAIGLVIVGITCGGLALINPKRRKNNA